jgi:hypothetical protein
MLSTEYKVRLFADDTNLFIAGRNIDLLNLTVNAAISRLNEWLVANKLSLNLEKTCYMVLGARWCHRQFLLSPIDSAVSVFYWWSVDVFRLGCTVKTLIRRFRQCLEIWL